jgi:hypothetical protein
MDGAQTVVAFWTTWFIYTPYKALYFHHWMYMIIIIIITTKRPI